MNPARFVRDGTYLYKLNPKDRPFETGTVNNNQVFIGLSFPHIVAVFFDSEGNVLCSEQRRLSLVAEAAGQRRFYSQEFREHVRQELAAWKNELEFVSGPITVKRFEIRIYELRIDDYPGFIQEILSSPGDHSIEDCRTAQQALATWETEGQFVLHWGNEYWVNKEGDVVAS